MERKIPPAKCNECTLNNNPLVLPRINLSKAILLCEAPGREEAEQQLYLVGSAGKELALILKEIGYDLRTDFNILNVCCCRPTEGTRNRTPTESEIKCCYPLLAKNIVDIQPDKIIIMGRIPYIALFGDTKIKIGDLVGQELKWGNYDVMVTYHPAAILHAGGTIAEKGKKIRKQIKDDLIKALQKHTFLQKQLELFDSKPYKDGKLYAIKEGYIWRNGRYREDKT
jgi:uracil-DNA glycosylase family 4